MKKCLLTRLTEKQRFICLDFIIVTLSLTREKNNIFLLNRLSQTFASEDVSLHLLFTVAVHLIQCIHWVWLHFIAFLHTLKNFLQILLYVGSDVYSEHILDVFLHFWQRINFNLSLRFDLIEPRLINWRKNRPSRLCDDHLGAEIFLWRIDIHQI